ncbi:MAG TPA: DMT family transporter [Candidatus Polarisedimenticolia bacterium]|nr:DMT family transporter [Candidatus Polarisedimenticolia bacterium]
MGLSRRLQADLWIILLSAIWGCTFVVLKRALDDISPMLLVLVRFTLAAPLLWLLVPAGALQPGALRGGAVTGLLLFLGFAAQTIGIQWTTPARSGFITGMYLVFTPLLAVLVKRRWPSVDSLAGVAMATAGLFLLTQPAGSGAGFGRGEILTLLCAAAFAGHLLAVDHYTRLFDKSGIAFLQVAAVAVLALPCLALETPRLQVTLRLMAALGVMAVLATAIAFYVLNTVQSWTTPTRAAIIFAAEPVFAALTSWLAEGERLTAGALAGAGLIVAGMLSAELSPFSRRRASDEAAA